MTSTLEPSAPVSTGTRLAPLRGWLWGSAAAVLGNLAVLVVGNLVLSGTIQVADPAQQVTDLAAAAVVAASIVPLLVGAGLLWVLGRFTGAALRIWTAIVAVVTVLSLAAPLTLPVDGGSKAALVLMHLLTGGAAIWGQRFAASRRA